jgi:FkbM family methyltransferase
MNKFIFLALKFTPKRLIRWLCDSKFSYGILKPICSSLTKNDQLKTYQIHDDVLMDIDISEDGERAICFGLYEPEMTQYFSEIAKKGGIVFDVGAWIGYYTILAARTAEKAVAIEVDSMNCQRIRRNVCLNGFSNVDIINSAIGDRSSSGRLLRGEHSYLHKVIPDGRGETVTIEFLDNLIGKLGTNEVNLVIMDIEGYEYFAIKGLEASLSSGIVKNLICEIHPAMLKENGCSEADILDLLSKYKYKVMYNSKTSKLTPYHIYAKYIEEYDNYLEEIKATNTHRGHLTKIIAQIA